MIDKIDTYKSFFFEKITKSTNPSQTDEEKN